MTYSGEGFQVICKISNQYFSPTAWSAQHNSSDMTTQVTMGSGELMQPSRGCTTGKKWRKMYSCIASTAKYVLSKRWKRLDTSKTISGLGPCPWNSSPWTWWVDSQKPPVAMNIPSLLYACWQAMCSVSPWRLKQQRKLWTNTSPVSPSHLETAERSCQTMVQSSKILYSRRYTTNWVLKGKFIHQSTDHSIWMNWRISQVPERMHFKTYGEQSRVGWYPTIGSCSLQLVPKWTLKGTSILSHVQIIHSDTLCWAHQTKMKIPWRHQRSAKNWTTKKTLPNYSIQPVESEGTLHKGSNPKVHFPTSFKHRRCCPGERPCQGAVQT